MPSDADRRRKYELDMLRGISHKPMPAEPIRQRLLALLEQGATAESIGIAASVSGRTILNITEGRYKTVRRPAALILSRLTLADILADDRDGGFVPALGARRRIQALMALGYTHEHMHRIAGVHTSRVLTPKGGQFVTRAMFDAIATMYERLSIRLGPSELTRTRSRKRGYVPPLCWDEGTIDDPAARPIGAGWRPINRGSNGAAAEDTAFLLATGASIDEIARRRGITVNAVEQTVARIKAAS